MEAGQAVLVDLDHEIDHGIHFEPTVGHTPGHVAVALASNGARAIFHRLEPGAGAPDTVHPAMVAAHRREPCPG